MPNAPPHRDSTCPLELELALYLEGAAQRKRGEIDAHIDVCWECRQVLIAARKSAPSVPEEWNIEAGGKLRESLARAVVDAEQRYVITGEQGRGGEGVVLAACDRVLQRVVAYKVFSTSLGMSNEEQEQRARRFLREARIASRLTHPGTVPVYEIGPAPGGGIFYTMKLLRGHTLKEAIANARDLAGRLALLPRFAGVCHTLAYAHSQGVLHRDIKPHNIMVGEFGETVVIDWGLARAADVAAEPAAKTEATGSVLGTPAYMSPEQADGRLKDIDERSDVWSLGAVLYELLSGRPPFGGETATQILSQVRAKAPAPLASLDPAVPMELAAIAEKALRRDKSERYQSAQAMADDLDAYMAGKRVGAYSYKSTELLKRFAKANKAAVASAAIVLVTVLVALVTVALSYNAERAARSRAETLAEKEAQARLRASTLLSASLLEKAERLRMRGYGLDAAVYASLSLEHNQLTAPGTGTASENARVLRLRARGELFAAGQTPLRGLLFRTRVEEEPRALAVSPSSGLAVCGTSGGTLRLYDIATGRLLSRIHAHSSPVLDTAFLNDNVVVSIAKAEPATLWNVLPGSPPTLARRAQLPVSALALVTRPEREQGLAIDERSDLYLILADRPPERLIHLPPADVTALAATSDLKAIVIAERGGGVYHVELSHPSSRRLLGAHRGWALGAAIDAQGEFAASAGLDKIVRVYSLRDDSKPYEIADSDNGVLSLALGAGSRVLFSGSQDGELRGFHVDSHEALFAASSRAKVIYDVVWDERREIVLTAGADPTSTSGWLEAWRIEAPRLALPLPQAEPNWGAVYSPDGRWIATPGYESQAVQLFERGLNLGAKRLKGHEGAVSGVAFSADVQRLVSSSHDGTVRVWSASTAQSEAVLAGAGDMLLGVALSPDGQEVAAADLHGRVHLWSMPTAQTAETRETIAPRAVIDSAPQRSISLAYSPDGSALAVAHWKGPVRLWDTRLGTLREELAENHPWSSTGFSGNGRTLFLGGQERVVVWNADGSRTALPCGHDGELLYGLALSKSGDLLAASGEYGTICLWSLPSLRPLVQYRLGRPVQGIAISPNGRELVISTETNIRFADTGGLSRLEKPEAALLATALEAAGISRESVADYLTDFD